MNRPHTPSPLQRTDGGKTHFDVLDGLRGTAALLVVLFHIQGIGVAFAHDKLILPHAYLAVDFFFALSGFVIGYAYDDRWATMSTRQFFVARLIRLHPLVVAGAMLGVSSYLFDPFAGTSQSIPLALVLAAFALCLLVLPAPILDNRWHDTHPINSPSWSLLQEYIANIAYALVLRFLSVRALCIVASVAWAALAGGALTAGSLDIGYGWDNLWGRRCDSHIHLR
ncbi:acyltransferase [Xanthomonas sp. NCPPB 1067]|uniref:acyltransferase family protein n=1 Tax=Xanthomonas sp. NCPPB 1067 TaxID=487524 RepID=UPI002107881E|nr:acyltransferase [Xanthomonas sp. NCPPB 1067]MCC4588021.1 acyltransferase [Xanthomonas sp. NCPPB 1067]